MSDVSQFFIKMSSFGSRQHLSDAAVVRLFGGRVNDCGSAASKGLQRPHMGKCFRSRGPDRSKRVVSRFLQAERLWRIEIKLGCRSTVFVIPILRRCVWRQPTTRRFEVEDLASDLRLEAHTGKPPKVH